MLSRENESTREFSFFSCYILLYSRFAFRGRGDGMMVMIFIKIVACYHLFVLILLLYCEWVSVCSKMIRLKILSKTCVDDISALGVVKNDLFKTL